MSYKVTAADLNNLRLNETDPVKSVLQNVAIIIATRKGSVPLYREFGLSWAFLDRPIPAAKPMFFAEIKEAVEEFEPRAEVLNVTFAEDPLTPGKLIPTVEVNIVNE